MEIFKLDYRKLIRISGIDTRNFLQKILSNDIKKLEVKKLQYSLLLTPQGKIMYDFFIFQQSKYLYLDCYAIFLQEIIHILNYYKLRCNIEITQDHSAIYISNYMLNKNCFEDPRDSRLGYRFYDFDCKTKKTDLKKSVIDYYTSLRLQHLVPEFGIDFISKQLFPLDLRMHELNAVNFNKGCFVGQEVTARMHYRNRIKKRLLYIELEGYIIDHKDIIKDNRKLGIVLNQYQDKALVLLKN